MTDLEERTLIEARLFFELEPRGSCTAPHGTTYTIAESRLVKDYGIPRRELYELVEAGVLLANVTSPYAYFFRHQIEKCWQLGDEL